MTRRSSAQIAIATWTMLCNANLIWNSQTGPINSIHPTEARPCSIAYINYSWRRERERLVGSGSDTQLQSTPYGADMCYPTIPAAHQHCLVRVSTGTGNILAGSGRPKRFDRQYTVTIGFKLARMTGSSRDFSSGSTVREIGAVQPTGTIERPPLYFDFLCHALQLHATCRSTELPLLPPVKQCRLSGGGVPCSTTNNISHRAPRVYGRTDHAHARQ